MKISQLIAVVLVGLAGTVNAQEKVKLSDSTQLVYAGVKGDREGLYQIKNLKNDGVWVQGNYKNDARTGTWYFFNSKKELDLRYSYDQKKLLFFNNDMLKDVTVEILSDDSETKKSATAPLPLCPIELYASIVASKVNDKNDGGNDPFEAEITAEVATDGTATYTAKFRGVNKKVITNSLNVPQDHFNIDWIPAMYKGKPIASKFVVYAQVQGNGTSNYRRFRWND
ncbi:hypothetical protein FPZ43_06220 [Mucilaginibacter pallidiroseus]|uniref:Uncharacterized protein n=1 Tax=Mucilaginibacter pallidiroseus TaxID=2599295 RepID=A0A563UGR2_9SPHI|nr:hypothetical protein [Mucilaginibacter pallidiroseus]TWR30531.1 hypothetical protein FPZ43_06220 [Mucilaginibacter pallidiroseus]